MKVLQSICLFSLVVFLGGCETETLFHADFNADTVGDRPNLSPPGMPTGDQIYLSNPDGNAPDTVVVVNDADFGNSLKYMNVNQPLYYRYLGFISDEADVSSTDYTAIWAGKVNLPSTSSYLDIWVGDSHFLPVVLLRFENGSISVQTSWGEDPSFEPVGRYSADESHTFIISIDREAYTYGVSFFQSGNNFSVGPSPALNDSAVDSLNPSIFMWFGEEVSSSGYYIIDDVSISQTLPDDTVMPLAADGLAR